VEPDLLVVACEPLAQTQRLFAATRVYCTHAGEKSNLAGWIVGFTVALLSVILAAVLWRSRTL